MQKYHDRKFLKRNVLMSIDIFGLGLFSLICFHPGWHNGVAGSITVLQLQSSQFNPELKLLSAEFCIQGVFPPYT